MLLPFRHYLQPQWIVDCVNNRKLLPVDDYLAGVILPPHLSPFVEEQTDDYVPPERQEIIENEKKMLGLEVDEHKEADRGKRFNGMIVHYVFETYIIYHLITDSVQHYIHVNLLV